MAHVLAQAKNGRGDSFGTQGWVLRFSQQPMRTEARFWSQMFPTASAPSVPSLAQVCEPIEIPGTLENQVGDHLSHLRSSSNPVAHCFVYARGAKSGVDSILSPHRDMGPNPRHPASRGNVERQESIYLSELPKTANSRSAAAPGIHFVCWEFTLARDSTIVDLCQVFDRPNPFTTSHLAWALDLSDLLQGVAMAVKGRGDPAGLRDDAVVGQHRASSWI